MSALSAQPTVMPDQDNKLFYRNWLSWRTMFSGGMSLLAGSLTVIACVPLFSVLIMLIYKGGSRLVAHGGWRVFADGVADGGFANALIGTIVMVILAALFAVPVGILGAIYLTEYSNVKNVRKARIGIGIAFAVLAAVKVLGPVLLILTGAMDPAPPLAQELQSLPLRLLLWVGIAGAIGAAVAPHLATMVRFGAKVLTGLPSILAGIFAYAAIVMVMGHPNAWAGGIALAVLMLPIVLLTAEEAIRMVPAKMKQAAVGMGATTAQVTWKVVVPTALPGILTGVMLALARAAGETAPLLFAAKFANYDFAINARAPFLHLNRETASMAVYIYNSSGSPIENLIELAWCASLVLVVLVLLFNVTGQLLSRKSRPAGR